MKRVSTLEYAPRYSRLAGDIACYEPQLRKRIAETEAQNEQWAIEANLLLGQAKNYLSEYKIDEGWKSFHSAKRMEIFGMNKHERQAIARSICREADKLNEWRRDGIFSLLGSRKGEVTEAPDAESLYQAAELKDEHYNNQYYMNRLSHNLFWLLSALLFLVLLAIVGYFLIFFNSCANLAETGQSITDTIIGVLLFGLLGALTSAIISTRKLSVSSRIKEISSSEVVVMSKIFIGAGFSIFIFLLLRSSIASGIHLFSFSITTPVDYFAIAFASGFTERLAQKSMDLIVGKEKAGAKSPEPDGDSV